MYTNTVFNPARHTLCRTRRTLTYVAVYTLYQVVYTLVLEKLYDHTYLWYRTGHLSIIRNRNTDPGAFYTDFSISAPAFLMGLLVSA